ncbi:MAG: glycosyltransferase family 2 protein [Clostridium sp.]|jgi:rhamnosyltransferase|nr:glycosyltransferase family 2 protein [Clostridium sp.]
MGEIPSVDLIIPVYRPDERLFRLVGQLEEQTIPLRSLILINTEEKYFGRLTAGTDFPQRYENVTVCHVSKREFDHGGTRHWAVGKSSADVFVMMTQDAFPADRYLLENLTRNLKGKAAAAYARQLPARGCNEAEKYLRRFNYPEESAVKTREDLSRLGVKAYFCSNVCAAYRREIYEELGGFPRHIIFNEDMIYAAKAIRAGYEVRYEARARVIHSHNYTAGQQFRRSFDLGVSQADHPEVFAGVSSEAEGRRMLREVGAHLKRSGLRGEIPGLYVQSACKYAGFWLGKHYAKLPKRLVAALSMNREYWEQ